MSAGSIKTYEDILDMKKFLDANNGIGMKVYARLTSQNLGEGLEELVKTADGIVIHHDDREIREQEEELFHMVKHYGKPLIVALSEQDSQDDVQLEQQLDFYVSAAVDVITIAESVLNTVENPLEYIQHIFTRIHDIEGKYLQQRIVRS